MVDAVKQFAGGKPAIGTVQPRVARAKLRSFEGIVPKGTDWRTLNVAPEELEISKPAVEEVR